MNFTDIFIKRPVLSMVVSLLLVLVGIISLTKLSLRQFPLILTSVVTVNTSYPGASGELMESFVTTPMENALAGVDGLDYIESQSSFGSSAITLHFKLGYDISKAVVDVGDQVNSIRYQLPTDIKDPVIAKNDPNANPILYIAFKSKSRSPEAIYDFLKRRIQTQFQTIDGVGKAEIMGSSQFAMRVWLDPERMSAHGVTASDIATQLQNNNIRSSAGIIENTNIRYQVRAPLDLHDAKQFANLAVKTQDNHIIRIRDIGHVKLGAKSHDASVNFNGETAVVIAISPKSDGNPLSIAKLSKKKLSDIQKSLPGDLKAEVLWDSTIFIQASINEVISTIVEACIFVLLVIFIFLGSVRTLLIPGVTIFLSLIGVMSIMYWLDFSLNTMTLLSFVLAIGLVVDDAIVVSENVHRHMAEGLTPFKSAIIGAREIQFAIIAMTITLAAVYAPIGFMTGLTGSLFKEFAFTLAAAVIISGLIALTLSPMMCSKLLTAEDEKKALPKLAHKFSDKLAKGYKWLLQIVMKLRLIMIIGLLGIISAAIYLFMLIPNELSPTEDQGVIMAIIQGPPASNLGFIEKNTLQLAKIYEQIPEITKYGIINQTNSGISFVMLKPWDKRKRGANQIISELFQKVFPISGVNIFPLNPPNLPGTGGGNQPIQIVMQSTGSYEELANKANQVKLAAAQIPGVVNVNVDLKYDTPIVELDVDRDMAADMGITMQDIGNNLSSALSENETGRFSLRGESYDVIPQLAMNKKNKPDDIYQLYVRNQTNKLVALPTFAKINNKVIPADLPHFQKLRSATISANTAGGLTLGEAINAITKKIEEIKSADIDVSYAGTSRTFFEAKGAMEQTMIFALLFIYLILAAQFESFVDPLIIMFTVPLAATGALLLIWLSGSTMNIYTQIGLITLIGLITKNGILLIEFANQLQEKGYDRHQAIIDAAGIRLRPILMTTFAIILGAIPLALASGAGAESRMQMGMTIIGGMSFGTLMTLFVIPVIYSYIGSKKTKQPEIDY